MPGISGLADRVAKEKPIKSMAKGGMVKKTGMYKLHKGEMVMPAKITKKIKSMK
jgi:hypothetical protein